MFSVIKSFVTCFGYRNSLINESEPCPLCHLQHSEFYHQDKKRHYQHCLECDLVFVPRQFYLSGSAEKAEYDKHDNTILDDGYRRFLNRALEPVLTMVRQRFCGPGRESITGADIRSDGGSAIGLDFGCGEGAFLSKMAAESNLHSKIMVTIDNYDLYYHPDESRLKQSYDFIILTEVLEHLSAPDMILKGLLLQLNPNGFIAIMTKRVRGKEAFATWHYKNDPTHICFYSEATFAFVARQYGLKVEIISSDVIFLIKESL